MKSIASKSRSTPIARRAFVRRSLGASLALAGLSFLPGSARAWPWGSVVRRRPWRALSLAMLTQTHFAECVGEVFRLQSPEGEWLDLTLIEATALSENGARPGATRTPFSLIFRAPRERTWTQRIYHLTHPRLGTLDIFLVPIGPDDKGMRLEAVFN